MAYALYLTKQADQDIASHKKFGDKAILKKLYILLEELTKTPFQGTGKPEQLKHELSGLWSRRINREHRLIYEVKLETVFILSAKGHYVS